MELAAASSRPPTPASWQDSGRYGDSPPPQRKAPGPPGAPSAMATSHTLFAVSPREGIERYEDEEFKNKC